MNDPKKYLSILGVLAIACFALALMLGATFKSPAAVLQGLLTHDFDIWQYRMPRAILAVLVGAALALSGTIIQGIIHNPLASPDILSINQVQLLLAEKRTALSVMRTGIAVLALPLSIFSALIATSKWYNVVEVWPLLMLVVGINLGLAVFGVYLIARSMLRMRQYDRLIADIKHSHDSLRRLIKS